MTTKQLQKNLLKTRELMLQTNRKIAAENNITTWGDFILLHHGTSLKNHHAIVKSCMFKKGTWFSSSDAEARRYGMQATKGTPVVMSSLVYMGSLYYNGYFSANEDLHFHNSKYQPKDLKL